MTENEFEKLYNDACKAVYWTAMNLLRNKDEAEDVVQDTFITAYNSYDSLKDKDKAVAWVKKIAANKCLNILTRTRTVNVEDEVLEATEAVGEDFLPESLIESEEKRKILMELIRKCLSEDTYTIVVLFYFNDLSANEIAERLGMAPNAVFTRLNYARNKIKKEVSRYEKDNNDKLFSMGIPFLKLLFEKEASQAPFRPMPVSLRNIPASQATTSAAGSAASAAAQAVSKGGQAFMIKKIAIGAVAVLLAGGGGVLVYNAVSEPAPAVETVEVTNEAGEVIGTETVLAEDSSEPSAEATSETKTIKSSELDLTDAYVKTETRHVYYEDKTSIEKKTLVSPEYGTVAIIYYYSSSDPRYSWFEFDEDKNKIAIWSDNKDGSDLDRTVYEYCEYGTKKATSYDMLNGGAIEYYSLYEYDDQGRLLSNTTYNPDGTPSHAFTYEYEADGSYRETSEAFTSPVKSIYYAWYNADGKIQRSESHYDRNGEDRVSTSVWIYDGDKLVRKEQTNPDGNNYREEYFYDGSTDGSYTYYNNYIFAGTDREELSSTYTCSTEAYAPADPDWTFIYQ